MIRYVVTAFVERRICNLRRHVFVFVQRTYIHTNTPGFLITGSLMSLARISCHAAVMECNTNHRVVKVHIRVRTHRHCLGVVVCCNIVFGTFCSDDVAIPKKPLLFVRAPKVIGLIMVDTNFKC